MCVCVCGLMSRLGWRLGCSLSFSGRREGSSLYSVSRLSKHCVSLFSSILLSGVTEKNRRKELGKACSVETLLKRLPMPMPVRGLEEEAVTFINSWLLFPCL